MLLLPFWTYSDEIPLHVGSILIKSVRKLNYEDYKAERKIKFFKKIYKGTDDWQPSKSTFN